MNRRKIAIGGGITRKKNVYRERGGVAKLSNEDEWYDVRGVYTNKANAKASNQTKEKQKMFYNFLWLHINHMLNEMIGEMFTLPDFFLG